MITQIQNMQNIQDMQDIERLRYDIVRMYDIPEFNGSLKAFVMEQLDGIINGRDDMQPFIEFQRRLYEYKHNPMKNIVAAGPIDDQSVVSCFFD